MSEDQVAETSLDDGATSPEVEVYEDEVEVEGNAEYEGNEDSEEQPPEPEDDSEDLDFNGQTHKLPKTIAEAVRGMQKDYTVKTQAVAEQRRAFEAEVQFQKENLQEIAKVTAMDDQIGQYKNLDWAKISAEDPVLFNQLRFQYDELKEARQNLAGTLAQKQSVALHNQQEDLAKRLQESDAVLRREIKDWSPEKESSLQNFAVQQYGLDLEEVKRSKADPRLYKLLNDAFIGQSLLKKQTAKPAVVPKKVAPVTVLSSKSPSLSKRPDQMSDDEYAKYRANVIKKRR